MNAFRWSRSEEMQADNQQRDAAAEYAESLAVWQVEHDADGHDFTPTQRDRFRLFVRATNAGVDWVTVVYWRYLIRTGQVTL